MQHVRAGQGARPLGSGACADELGAVLASQRHDNHPGSGELHQRGADATGGTAAQATPQRDTGGHRAGGQCEQAADHHRRDGGPRGGERADPLTYRSYPGCSDPATTTARTKIAKPEQATLAGMGHGPSSRQGRVAAAGGAASRPRVGWFDMSYSRFIKVTGSGEAAESRATGRVQRPAQR